MGGAGSMVLIYPRTHQFSHPLAPFFDFGGGLVLEVLPFDLDQELLLGIQIQADPSARPWVDLIEDHRV